MALLLGAMGGTLPTQADAGGVPISVEVLGPETTPAPSASPTATASPTSTWPPRATKRPRPTRTPKPLEAGATPSASAQPSAPGGVSEDEEISIRGLLFISGITPRHAASINPLGGRLELAFTVRNASTVAVDADADFWVTHQFGGLVGEPVPVAIRGLEPDESRTVTATIDGMGQWTFVTAHVTFTPPEFIGKTEMTPVTRDAVVFFVPWWLTAFTSLGITGAAFWPRLWPMLRPRIFPHRSMEAAL